ncbi:hypothetical protein ACFCXH_09815 [Streptomyces nojiriensis]|uniref:hypothetical protein n=1 Tax=Streptomyces nojiriensis TaxID=66374 RepID=UPI0035E25D7C
MQHPQHAHGVDGVRGHGGGAAAVGGEVRLDRVQPADGLGLGEWSSSCWAKSSSVGPRAVPSPARASPVAAADDRVDHERGEGARLDLGVVEPVGHHGTQPGAQWPVDDVPLDPRPQHHVGGAVVDVRVGVAEGPGQFGGEGRQFGRRRDGAVVLVEVQPAGRVDRRPVIDLGHRPTLGRASCKAADCRTDTGFDAYTRHSAVAEVTPDAVDVSDTEPAPRIVKEEPAGPGMRGGRPLVPE